MVGRAHRMVQHAGQERLLQEIMTKAFPVSYTSDHDFNEGMTLRDYFAAKAMQALLSNSDAAVQIERGRTVSEARERLSAIAYVTADAMLKARES